MSPVCKPYTKKMTKRKMPPSQAAQIGENSEKRRGAKCKNPTSLKGAVITPQKGISTSLKGAAAHSIKTKDNGRTMT
ncbi:hypothetical protein [Kosakonia pseudosacchari]|uniref:hypothetical protein n=1 Tax=Kosakonia pseudosacchari TaxID=1646340 RepID=UPI001141B726|nr:hypothetical protein [Kosakonia pseudosacchari]